jgi:hypothetical protein
LTIAEEVVMGKKFKHPRDWADTITVQPMAFPVLVVTPSSLAKFLEHMEHHECGKHFQADIIHHTEKAKNGGACFYFDSGNYILLLPAEWDDESVFHEALHCAIRLWHDVGARLQLPRNEEVLTYTQGHIVQMLKKQIYNMKVK